MYSEGGTGKMLATNPPTEEKRLQLLGSFHQQMIAQEYALLDKRECKPLISRLGVKEAM